MLLFLQVLFTMFIAEMGDKTQLLMIAMTSRYKLRDILLGSAVSIMALNALAVALGALISRVVPMWLIKLIAGAAFFYFAWSSLHGEEGEEEHTERENVPPVLVVFGTFFLAELGDKTQLTAITFAANGGTENAFIVWLACSIGLFAADLIGMMAGYVLQKKMPEGFLDKLAFVIFAVFGFTTLLEGAGLLLGNPLRWVVTGAVTLLFIIACTVAQKKKKQNGN